MRVISPWSAVLLDLQGCSPNPGLVAIDHRLERGPTPLLQLAALVREKVVVDWWVVMGQHVGSKLLPVAGLRLADDVTEVAEQRQY